MRSKETWEIDDLKFNQIIHPLLGLSHEIEEYKLALVVDLFSLQSRDLANRLFIYLLTYPHNAKIHSTLFSTL